MADRDLANILASGEIPSIQLGGVSVGDRAVKQSGLDTTNDNVTTNTNDISTLKASGLVQDSKIASLEAIQSVYKYNKVSGISTTSETYSVANNLTLLDAEAGVYEYKFVMTFNYSVNTRSAYFRFSLDNGVVWYEIRKEVKDVTDNIPVYYGFPVIHDGGDINLIVEYRAESEGDSLNVSFMDIVIERKA